MDLDAQTLLLAMLFVLFLAALGCFLVWLQDRKQMAMLWITLSVTSIGAAMIGRKTLPFLAAIAFGNSAILIGCGLIWTAFLSLRNRPARPALLFLPSLIWIGLCFVPAFRANMTLRIGLGLLLLLVPIGLAVNELWQNKQASRYIRWPVLAVLGIQELLMLRRAISSLIRPDLTNVPFEQVPGFDILMIDLVSLMLILSFSMIAFVKDNSVGWHRDKARSDHLTGVGNRLHFDECLRQISREAHITRQPLSLIMVDADAFKEYNDLYGHPSGDRCLQELAATLVMCCRPTDMVGRYGGEEFAILLPKTDCGDAVKIADSMLNRVRSLRLKHAGRPGGIVTISLGVASWTPHMDRTTPADLVETADRALYRAKQEGRDRMCLSNDHRNGHADTLLAS